MENNFTCSTNSTHSSRKILVTVQSSSEEVRLVLLRRESTVYGTFFLKLVLRLAIVWPNKTEGSRTYYHF